MNRWLLLLSGLLCAAGTHAALPEGIAGPWYNHQQSGHGLSISLANRGTRGVVLWHVYDNDGAPLTLYVDALVQGRDLVGPAYAPRGMRFGEFDPDDIELPEWGTVRIRFNRCDSAVLKWDALDPAYADGEMVITPLARIGSLDCGLPESNPIPTGLYLGSVDPGGSSVPGSALGVVDLEGRLWGYSGELDAQGIRLFDVPGPTYVSAAQPQIFLSFPEHHKVTGDVSTRLLVLDPHWAWFLGGRSESLGLWSLSRGQNVGRFPGPTLTPRGDIEWEPAPESVARLVQPVDAAMLAGTYTYRLRGQFFEFSATLQIAEDGTACLGSAPDCDYSGHVAAMEGAHGLLDFRLFRSDDPRFASYAGRGWIDDSGHGRRLVLVGENGANGFALVANRMEDAQ
jgi:hypothetical protein